MMDTMPKLCYDLIPSPLGTLLVAWTDRGLREISFDADPRAAELERAGATQAEHCQAREELAEFFAGTRRSFTLPLDLEARSAFQQQVLEVLQDVEYGSTVGYGELAALAGSPAAARAVGGALNRNPLPLVIPCHRVIGANGNLVGYAGGLERKQLLLKLERGQ